MLVGCFYMAGGVEIFYICKAVSYGDSPEKNRGGLVGSWTNGLDRYGRTCEGGTHKCESIVGRRRMH